MRTKKKPRKSPSEVLPVKEFFGKWVTGLIAGQAAEKRSPTAPRVGFRRGLNLIKACATGNFEPLEQPARLICLYESSPKLWLEMREWWPVRLLRDAAEDGDSEGYKRLLAYFLHGLDIEPPEGVLIPFCWPRGRPNKVETAMIHREWVAKGRPTVNEKLCSSLAKTFYANEYATSGRTKQKTLRDRIRKTIQRLESPAT